MPIPEDNDSGHNPKRKHLAVNLRDLQPDEFALTMYKHRMVKVIDFSKRDDGRYDVLIEVGRKGDWLHVVTNGDKIVVITNETIYRQW